MDENNAKLVPKKCQKPDKMVNRFHRSLSTNYLSSFLKEDFVMKPQVEKFHRGFLFINSLWVSDQRI